MGWCSRGQGEAWGAAQFSSPTAAATGPARPHSLPSSPLGSLGTLLSRAVPSSIPLRFWAGGSARSMEDADSISQTFLFPGTCDLAMGPFIPVKSRACPSSTTVLSDKRRAPESGSFKKPSLKGQENFAEQLNHRRPRPPRGVDKEESRASPVGHGEQLLAAPSTVQQVISALRGRYAAIDFPLPSRRKLGIIPSQLL